MKGILASKILQSFLIEYKTPIIVFNTNYIYIHHTQHDYTDEVRPDYQRATARVVASAAWRLANMEPMVPRSGMGEPPKRQRLGIYLGENGKLDGVVEGSLAARAGMKEGS